LLCIFEFLVPWFCLDVAVLANSHEMGLLVMLDANLSTRFNSLAAADKQSAVMLCKLHQRIFVAWLENAVSDGEGFRVCLQESGRV